RARISSPRRWAPPGEEQNGTSSPLDTQVPPRYHPPSNLIVFSRATVARAVATPETGLLSWTDSPSRSSGPGVGPGFEDRYGTAPERTVLQLRMDRGRHRVQSPQPARLPDRPSPHRLAVHRRLRSGRVSARQGPGSAPAYPRGPPQRRRLPGVRRLRPFTK